MTGVEAFIIGSGIAGLSAFAKTYTRGLRGSDDIVWHILDAAPAVTSNG